MGWEKERNSTLTYEVLGVLSLPLVRSPDKWLKPTVELQFSSVFHLLDPTE